MPFIVINGPPIENMDKKRELVKGLSEVAYKVYDLSIQKMHVLIKENSKENVGIGGQLLPDKIKAERL